MRIKRVVADALGDALDADIDAADLEVPDPPEHGDVAFPAMQVSDDPRAAAESAVDDLEALAVVDRVEVAGPGYVNVFLDREVYPAMVGEMLAADAMGVEHRDGSVLLEFSSPNVAKPMHVGHFRNNALGDALQRILRFAGHDVTSENYIGDWGTQYGKLIHAFREYGSEEAFEEAPMEHMFDLYVKFHEEMDDDPEMEEKGREWAAKVEEGDEEARELWEMFRDASIAHHRQDYERMGVSFDRWTGESTVVEPARDLIEEHLEKGDLERDEDGSVFVEFDDLPGAVLLKADGSTLYITRDIYNLVKRNEEGFDHNLYVVASEQELHFRQVFAAAEMLGHDASGSEHVSYGLLDLPEGSMSSREGRIVRLADLLDEAEERALEAMEDTKRVDDTEVGRDTASKIGIGAAKYANLTVSRQKNIRFEWDRVLSFEGDSGPYLQYSHTRAASILSKADADGAFAGALDDTEWRLLTMLARFPEAVEDAADGRDPATLANHLARLCETFNTFYHECPVLDVEGDVKQRRLKLVELFEAVAGQGLELLGIEPLEEM